MVRAVGQDTFQPKIGFKTRYGIVAKQFAYTANATRTDPEGNIQIGNNVYYRKIAITNLM
jgi:hypothetical protein